MSSQVNPCILRPPSLYRCLKQRLGCSLRRLHGKWVMVSPRKSIAHKLSGVKGRPASLKKVSTCSARSNCSGCHIQHHSCSLHKQGGRYEVRFTLCPSMATPFLVQSEIDYPKGQTHSSSPKCDCGQVVSLVSVNSDGVVPPTGDVNLLCQMWHLPEVYLCATRSIGNLAKFVSRVPGPKSLCGRPHDGFLGGPGPICPYSSDPSQQSDQQIIRSPMQKGDPDSPGLAQHAMVLGSGGSLIPDTHLSPKPS